ncbi:citrate synthase-lysine N-methyltransferase CSKMT, mitochondrial [Bombina bombina]|uniref:citrate synthase-lysine N-methyltransferase CSKMT, mitochondrial n=1 Tax=Bombina bombina TaxID=8345 RepID=UPI00235A9788|nr:citrate synthase-lysine N-methyltransferase CSKMT, mitochondrial [Bombina bombina]XP_053558691.1 citrate synthase-lysine N-methyltransferase CSKMT, mitochondrial [Bombina bombina]
MIWRCLLRLSSVHKPVIRKLCTETQNVQRGESLRHNMGDRVTWDSFYSGPISADSSHFDWFFGYHFLRNFLLSITHDLALEGYGGPALRVLDVGCGTSDVGLGLYRDSPLPVQISCIDYSAPAVLAMNNLLIRGEPISPRHPDSSLEYIQGDVTNLHDIKSASVDLVLDKGTSDCLLRSGRGVAQLMVRESLRVLQPSGRFVQLTDEDPDARLPFLEDAGTGPAVALHDLGDNNGISYYAYIVTKSSHSGQQENTRENIQ